MISREDSFGLQLFNLKKLVSELRYTGDDLALDKALGEIDLVIYNLRTECIPPLPKGVRASHLDKPEDLYEALKDLFGE